MSQAELHDEGATTAPSTSSDLLSVIGELVSLCIRLSANVTSLAKTSADASRNLVSPMKTMSLLYNNLTRFLELKSGRPFARMLIFRRLEPLLACLSPPTTSLGLPRYGLFVLFLTWWIWRHSITWMLARAVM
ncbi:uncharacterized protein FPOAC1_013029 [Fusarium poae]|uniref:uncharacterized protein n=1 Tax=Fusarium poae TaxID=36050 RepID=UPI001D047C52|nr:uncharacterized protein FPOAC1_013803 [Fusarium poae]XP_044701554.1 uncharacterized protein FPOAC1_013029 [Fusarium poae]KAG8664465.1 hypothetical protein FPOAC1_013803 [Fusarium poae]KAG8665051.1 hypothetical protein FPOAC1_013029 [Fusarium poae]